METIKGIVKLVGECVTVLVLLVAYAILKVLYWGIMGIKFLIALVISLNEGGA